MKRFLMIFGILFCTTVFAHTIEWYVDGNLLSTTTCESGDNITPPTVPEKFGYHFKKWEEWYEFLEYIEGDTHEQYIDTQITPTSLMNIYYKIQYVSSLNPNKAWNMWGVRSPNSYNGVHSFTTVSDFNGAWFGTAWWTFNDTRSFMDIYEIDIKNSYWVVKKNNQIIGTHQFIASNTAPGQVFLNSLNDQGQSSNANKGQTARIYRFTIEGIADMRPARRLSDGAVGMYDTIREQFFTNAGTGQFIAGPVLTE